MKLGVCYYPEHWDPALWPQDAAQMKRLGLTFVRIGEFAWSRLEPEPGKLDWAWLDQAIEVLGRAGLQVILGTPTATPPKWLIDLYPDILPTDLHGNPRYFGSRRHYSFSSLTYRREMSRIIKLMGERYAANPYVVLWQTDNEYGCHDTVESCDPDAVEAFRRWLKQRYTRIDDLNAAWGTVFWSQEYQSFDEVDPPLATVTEANPSHRLDWHRFSSDQVRTFNGCQVETLRTAGVSTPITHNYMGHFNDFDHFAVGRDLELATWDSYPLGFLEQAWWDNDTKARYARTGHPDFAAFHHDLYRGIGQGRFAVMEQQPGPVNWARFNPDPVPGMVRLWTLEAAAHGAEFVSYFRWRQAPFAQEQMHAGLLRPDNEEAPATSEVRKVSEELEIIAGLEVEKAQVALIFDYESDWIFRIQPQGSSFKYGELVFCFYTALRRLGLDVDIVSRSHDLSGYALIVIPSLPILSDADIDALSATGGEILVGPRTGSKTETFQIPRTLAPGPLQRLLPLKVIRVESLRPGVFLNGQVMGTPCRVDRWREVVESELTPIGVTEDGGGMAWREGRIQYLSVWPDEALLDVCIKSACERKNLQCTPLPEGVRLRHTKTVSFVFNYGSALDLRGHLDIPAEDEFILGGPDLGTGGVAAWKRRASE